MLAWTLADIGDFERAVDLLGSALAIEEHPWAYELIGWVLLNLGRKRAEHALDAYRAALATAARCHYALGECDAAVRVYAEALYRDPAIIDVESNLALAHLGCGKCVNGARQLERSLIELELTDPLRRRGILRVANNELRQAIARGRVSPACFETLQQAQGQVRRALRQARRQAKALLDETAAHAASAGA
jgi:tetratricopeptide (TPR) repeat protein